jgi:hypothetical protein
MNHGTLLSGGTGQTSGEGERINVSAALVQPTTVVGICAEACRDLLS